MVLPKMALARLVSRRRAMRGAIAGVLGWQCPYWVRCRASALPLWVWTSLV